MAKLKLTHKGIKSLSTTKKREVFWHREFPRGGWFGVACFSSGKKSYIFSYRNHHNQQKQVTIGNVKTISFKEAQERALELLTEVNGGEDPAQQAKELKQADTVEELCQLWMKQHVMLHLTAKTQADYQRIVEKEILPVIGTFKAREVRRRDITSLLDKIYYDREKRTLACHTRGVLHTIFEFGIAKDILDTSPCVGLQRMKKGEPRNRVLLNDEIAAFLDALDAESVAISGLFKILLHTGQRAGEVCGMRWSEIHGNEWHLSAERAKNKRPHIVPLTPEVERILGQVRAANAQIYLANRPIREFVFASPGTKLGHIKWINKACHRIREKAEIAYFSPHDLRRTVTTELIGMGIPPGIVSKILNHKVQTVTSRHYDRSSQLQERRKALEKWSSRIELLNNTADKNLEVA